MKTAYSLLLCVATAIVSPAQVFTTLVNFNGSNGNGPHGAVVQGRDGNLYGTTFGNFTSGTIYRMTHQGDLTTLYTFDLNAPYDGLVLGTDGDLYGTSESGGGQGAGTVFRITEQGVLTTLYNFCPTGFCSDGRLPQGKLIQATDGNFYGSTYDGGNNQDCADYDEYGCGTIFQVTPDGELTNLHTFTNSDGAFPYDGLTEGINGELYGTASQGGANGGGGVFEISPQGNFKLLYSFDACQGLCLPNPNLIQTDDGRFFGSAASGGSQQGGGIFIMTPKGAVTTRYNFCNKPGCADGSEPTALILGSDGNFYGMTAGFNFYVKCVAVGCTTLFRITPQGALTVLHRFPPRIVINGRLLQATDGKFYGTTTQGGQSYRGTVFSLDVGLDPFVKPVNTAGQVGSVQGILGQGFTRTTSVTFSGTPANFTVDSDTYLEATVPAGATTGYVEVTTPGGTLKSDRQFRVLPQ